MAFSFSFVAVIFFKKFVCVVFALDVANFAIIKHFYNGFFVKRAIISAVKFSRNWFFLKEFQKIKIRNNATNITTYENRHILRSICD